MRMDKKGEERLRQKNLAVLQLKQARVKQLESKNLKKVIASERAHQRTILANEKFKLDTKRKLEKKNKGLEERLINLKHNKHRESNPELQDMNSFRLANIHKLSNPNSIKDQEYYKDHNYIDHDFKDDLEDFLKPKPKNSKSKIFKRNDSQTSLDNICQAALNKHKKTLKEKTIEKFYKVEKDKTKSIIPHLESYKKAKEAEKNTAGALKELKTLHRKLKSVCNLKEQRDTFGGTSERKLPFEGKKESVMNMQECVKIDKVGHPLKLKTGCETAFKYLKLRETKSKDIAMTLANKIHCKDPNLVEDCGRDGFVNLYESQMRNNEKEFKMVVDRIKKNIPNTQVDKYSGMRRKRSNEFFRDHNEIPYTKPPDNFFYQNKIEKNSFIQEIDEADKYIDEIIADESKHSDPGGDLVDDLAETKRIMKRHQSMHKLSNEEGKEEIINALKCLQKSIYGPKMTFSKLVNNILFATRKKKQAEQIKIRSARNRSPTHEDEEMLTDSQKQEREKAKIIEQFISKLPPKKRGFIKHSIEKSVLHPSAWIKVFFKDEKRKQDFAQRQCKNKPKQEISVGKLTTEHEIPQSNLEDDNRDVLKRFIRLLSQWDLKSKKYDKKNSKYGLAAFHSDQEKDEGDKIIKLLEDKLKKAEDNRKKFEEISLKPTMIHTASVAEKLRNYNKVQEETYTKKNSDFEKKYLKKKSRLYDFL
ncbi:unnamed protein product [Moneuplotes crassus]|uniref:Uncharacterized protein n=1 Tax=Euplotes crassus TaxID=5936 RepID=A0AAD2D9K5_EUPCR|nr:unnamed protein product [Moneuplotes crassus]